MRKDRLAYELGVMMFNAFNSGLSSIDTENYDILGNFISLLYATDLSYEDLREGYIAEGTNYDVTPHVLNNWFELHTTYLEDI